LDAIFLFFGGYQNPEILDFNDASASQGMCMIYVAFMLGEPGRVKF